MASSRSLEDWLAYQSELHPQAIDLGLMRLRQVLERLDWRQPAVPVITVAGTNGKGSVTAYCTAILTAAGLRVGTFTSPHLRDYRERIRLAGRMATAQELVWAFELIEAARTSPSDISLTFFEYNALAAFLLFQAANVDAWVLEVGMGGRLDAVNVVDPSVAVVVSIGLDHQEFLGPTREAIAVEKAGIFRAGRAAVLGSRDVPPNLEDCARAMGATPKRLGAEFDYARGAREWRYRGTRWNLAGLPVPALLGETQFANAATALAALEEIPWPQPLSAAAIANGLESVRLAGRFQLITAGPGNPQWILDVAHNPDAAQTLARHLRELPGAERSLAVCGFLEDKDAAGIVSALRGCFDAWWLTSTHGARGIRADALSARIADQITSPVFLAHDVAAACAAAYAAAGPRDRIVVFGSFHTVGPALDWLESHDLLPPTADAEYTSSPRGQ
jgi:dihydrofolate synthase/folylpolyglutamate synthase